MNDIVTNYQSVVENIKIAFAEAYQNPTPVQVICVSKGRGGEEITPLLSAGVHIFGENRSEEAEEKWAPLLQQFPDIELHFIGALQSRKIKKISAFFHTVHSLASLSHAKIFAGIKQSGEKIPRLFVQVNTGAEPQKSGVPVAEAFDFIQACNREFDLPIAGVMCIPPAQALATYHFCLLKNIAREAGNLQTSMGMSADYRQAALCGSDYVRVGSEIFNKIL